MAPKRFEQGAEAADRWEAGNMAKVLLGRADYKDAVTHFAGEFKRDPAAAKSYTAAVYDDMAKASPKQAVQFMGQMKAAGLVEEQKAEAAPTSATGGSPTGQKGGKSDQTASLPNGEWRDGHFKPNDMTEAEWKRLLDETETREILQICRSGSRTSSDPFRTPVRL